MLTRHLTVEVICHWSVDPPCYRIFVDQDLITERSYNYAGFDFFIRENLAVNLPAGMHSIRLENISPNGKFTLKNLTVDGEQKPDALLSTSEDGNILNWNFALHQ